MCFSGLTFFTLLFWFFAISFILYQLGVHIFFFNSIRVGFLFCYFSFSNLAVLSVFCAKNVLNLLKFHVFQLSARQKPISCIQLAAGLLICACCLSAPLVSMRCRLGICFQCRRQGWLWKVTPAVG